MNHIIYNPVFCYILCSCHLLLLHIKNRRTLVFSLTFVPITWHGDLVCRLQYFFSLSELMLFFSTLPYWDSVGSLWWKILHFKLSNLFLYVSCLIVTTWRYTSTLWKFVNWDFSRVTWGCLEHMVVGYTTTYMHSEPISTNVVSSNPTHG